MKTVFPQKIIELEEIHKVSMIFESRIQIIVVGYINNYTEKRCLGANDMIDLM